MRITRQVAVVIGLGALLLGLALLTGPSEGQVIVQPKKGPVPTPPPAGGANAALFSAIKLVEDRDLRQYIAVAQDCIKDKAWNEAITALQAVLDKNQDSYVQVRQRDPQGQETVRWTSVKFEANNLLGSMHEEGLGVYEV